MRKSLLTLFSVLIVGAMLLSACGTTTETVIETVIVEKEGETIIETVIVEKEVEAEMQPVTLNWNRGTGLPVIL